MIWSLSFSVFFILFIIISLFSAYCFQKLWTKRLLWRQKDAFLHHSWIHRLRLHHLIDSLACTCSYLSIGNFFHQLGNHQMLVPRLACGHQFSDPAPVLDLDTGPKQFDSHEIWSIWQVSQHSDVLFFVPIQVFLRYMNACIVH